MCTHLMGVGTDWDTECSAETKISNFYRSLIVNEQILWLEVAVDDTAHVHKHYTLKNLVCVALQSRSTLSKLMRHTNC